MSPDLRKSHENFVISNLWEILTLGIHAWVVLNFMRFLILSIFIRFKKFYPENQKDLWKFWTKRYTLTQNFNFDLKLNFNLKIHLKIINIFKIFKNEKKNVSNFVSNTTLSWKSVFNQNNLLSKMLLFEVIISSWRQY